MSKPDIIALIHTLDDYELIRQAADDSEIEDAITELALADGEEGE